MAMLTCRVQYLNDIDPFSASTNFPEPTRPPSYAFNVNIPLIDQIAGVHRLLRAPQNVSIQFVYELQVSLSASRRSDLGRQQNRPGPGSNFLCCY